MTGFTLYETLRIFLPGSIAVFIADVVLRLSYGSDAIGADGHAKTAIDALEKPAVAVVIAVTVGLLLYAADLPMKLRLASEADPDRGKRLPTNVLASHLAGGVVADKSFSLYFLLSDKYLPAEFHRRVYLFGSLYRVYVDLRMLMVAGLAVGAWLSLFGAQSETPFDAFPAFDPEAAAVILAVLVAAAAVASAGVRSHALSWLRKHQQLKFRSESRKEIREIRLCAITVAVLTSFGYLLTAVGGVVLRIFALGLVGAGLSLWFSVEIGPPKGLWRGHQDWRSRVLHRLKADHDGPQYGPLQRAACDIAIIAPSLVAASVASANQKRPAATLLVWSILALPPVAIAAFRKHEVRQLANYEDQSVWLDMQASKLIQIRDSGLLPDEWK